MLFYQIEIHTEERLFMRRFLFITCVLFVFFSVFSSTLFALDFFIGANIEIGYAPNSDMNGHVADAGESYASDLNSYLESYFLTADFSTDDKKADICYGVDLEPRLFFGPLGIGISAGYHLTSRALSDVESPTWIDNTSFSLKLKVIPVTGTLYCKFNLKGNKSLLLGAGAGYYMSTITSVYEDDVTVSVYYGQTFERDWKADGTIGYHAKLEFNRLLRSVNVFYGVMGRYLEIEDFKDEGQTLKNSDGSVLKAGLTGVQLYGGVGFML